MKTSIDFTLQACTTCDPPFPTIMTTPLVTTVPLLLHIINEFINLNLISLCENQHAMLTLLFISLSLSFYISPSPSITLVPFPLCCQDKFATAAKADASYGDTMWYINQLALRGEERNGSSSEKESKREKGKDGGLAAPKKGKHFTYCYPGHINKAAAVQEQLKKSKNGEQRMRMRMQINKPKRHLIVSI